MISKSNEITNAILVSNTFSFNILSPFFIAFLSRTQEADVKTNLFDNIDPKHFPLK